MIDRPRTSLTPRFALVACVYVLAAATILAWLWWSGRPVPLSSVAGGRVQCLSYSPPHADPAEAKVIPLARIRADLEHLAAYTKCVRTYSVYNGLDQVPEVARALELKVMLGIWIGEDKKQNDWEVRRALELAYSHHDVIESIVVGNEVLLRREQTPAALKQYIHRVRTATDLPITYADVWEFWERNPEVAQDVSFVTVHMLPYWEDFPVAIDHAVPHIGRVLQHMQRVFPRHPVVIGEAGWPSTGRQRAGAVPSRVNQARFFREFTRYADQHGVQYNFIEAFDQPWKRTLEGTVGGAWGLFDTHSRLKFPLQGAVENNPRWRVPVSAAFIAAVSVLVVCAWCWRRQRAWLAVIVAALAAASGAAIAVLQWEYLLVANRDTWEWLGSVAWFAGGWSVYVCATGLILRAMRNRTAAEPVASAAMTIVNEEQRWAVGQRARTLLSFGRMIFLFGLAYLGLLLTMDPRYRDFPLIAAILPAMTLWLHSLLVPANARAGQPFEELLLACWLVVASVWVAIAEGFENLESLAWCGVCLLVALTVLWTHWRSSEREGAAEQAQRGELDPI
ncbi:MAG: hypothetical protein ABW110_16035 [Steroidobacteraceae bacterium]